MTLKRSCNFLFQFTFRYIRISILTGCLFVLIPQILSAQQDTAQPKVSKEDVLAHYDEAVALAEELNVYQDDVFNTVPKLRMAGNALLGNDFAKADRVLKEALDDLKLLKAKKPISAKRQIWFGWLEVFFDIFQKFVLIILVAYLLIRWPFFNRMIHANRFSFFGKLYLAFFLSSAAFFLSFLDLLRYGESSWAFLDLQIVLVTVGGILGGFLTGILSGLLLGAFRFVLNPAFIYYAVIVFLAGVISAIASRKIKNFQNSRQIGFATGAIIGAIQALIVYTPTINLMPWFYFLFTIAFIAFLEGGSVFVFLNFISGVVREQNRRRMEQDLLKTKLLFLQAQMSPHFLFNALNTISSICSRESAPQAQHLVLRLAEFLRRTLKREEEKISLREEIAYVDSYLEIEKARYQDRLNVVKKLELTSEQMETKIPILILQPLVENAVRHGIAKKEQGGTVQIQAAIQERVLNIDITDDGVGMDMSQGSPLTKDKEDRSEGLGIGVKNIHQRLVRFYGEEYGLCFQSEKGKGTTVSVRIPIPKGEGKT